MIVEQIKRANALLAQRERIVRKVAEYQERWAAEQLAGGRPQSKGHIMCAVDEVRAEAGALAKYELQNISRKLVAHGVKLWEGEFDGNMATSGRVIEQALEHFLVDVALYGGAENASIYAKSITKKLRGCIVQD